MDLLNLLPDEIETTQEYQATKKTKPLNIYPVKGLLRSGGKNLSVTNIFIDRKTQKQLDKLPKNIQDKVCDAIDILQQKRFLKMGLYKFSCKAAPLRLFSFLFVLLLVFSLSVGMFTSNATGQQTLTAENVSMNITTGSNTYKQGDIVSFKMTSNTTPTGNLYLVLQL